MKTTIYLRCLTTVTFSLINAIRCLYSEVKCRTHMCEIELIYTVLDSNLLDFIAIVIGCSFRPAYINVVRRFVWLL